MATGGRDIIILDYVHGPADGCRVGEGLGESAYCADGRFPIALISVYMSS